MHHDEKLRDKLTTYIQDAYAMENQIVETLEDHLKQAEKHPSIQAKVREHLEATKQHRDRMARQLEAYNEKPSTVKGAMSNLMGKATGVVSGLQPDTIAMNARNEYVTEHLEIAAYTLLIATARAYGDEETVRAAEQNLRDEEEMQRWLLRQMPEVALRSLEEDGITIPANARQMAQQPIAMEAMEGQAGMSGPA